MASSRKAAPDLEQRVGALLRRHVAPDSRLTVAYSGGLDSSVLLHLLAGLRHQLGVRLDAAHVHHGLSPLADDWAAHCAAVCASLGVPLRLHRVTVHAAGEGPEAAARAARYRVFAMLDSDMIALAHHRDDQAETVLLQLLRGGGPRGLAAMPALRAQPAGGAMLLRPLLACSRAELESWARRRGLAWVEDDSNADIGLARNALRHDVMPVIERHFPGAAARLGEAAARHAEVAALLDDLADLDAVGAVCAEGLLVGRLAALPEARARNLLRRFLERGGARVREDVLCEGLRQLLVGDRAADIEVVFGNARLRRFRGVAHLLAAAEAAPAVAVDVAGRVWHGEEWLDLGMLGGLRFRRAAGDGLRLPPGAVHIRARRGGECLSPGIGRPRRALKSLLREAGIPPWQRARLPLLYVGEELAWVAGVGADARFRAGAGQEGWLISWERPW